MWRVNSIHNFTQVFACLSMLLFVDNIVFFFVSLRMCACVCFWCAYFFSFVYICFFDRRVFIISAKIQRTIEFSFVWLKIKQVLTGVSLISKKKRRLYFVILAMSTWMHTSLECLEHLYCFIDWKRCHTEQTQLPIIM